MRLKYLALALAGRADRAGRRARRRRRRSSSSPASGLEQTPATPAYDVIELDREKIVSGSSGRIEDVLVNVAGFQQFRRSDSRSSNPSAQGVTLRALGGNATSRALVLLDAVPMLDPFFGYVPFSAIAPERLESIRVTRGGGSGPFGSGALAGAIELDSADAATLGLFSGAGLDQRPRRDRAVGHGRARARRRLRGGQRALGPRQGLLHHARGAARAGDACAPSSTPGRRARGWCSRSPTTSKSSCAAWRSTTSACCASPAPTPAARARTSARGWSAAGRGRSTRSPMRQWRNFTQHR